MPSFSTPLIQLFPFAQKLRFYWEVSRPMSYEIALGCVVKTSAFDTSPKIIGN
jgi:hypothetical protein